MPESKHSSSGIGEVEDALGHAGTYVADGAAVMEFEVELALKVQVVVDSIT